MAQPWFSLLKRALFLISPPLTATGKRLQDNARVLERQPEQAAHLRVPGAHVRRLQRDDAEPVHGGVVSAGYFAVDNGAATSGVGFS